jgi:hypothetical protein
MSEFASNTLNFGFVLRRIGFVFDKQSHSKFALRASHKCPSPKRFDAQP